MKHISLLLLFSSICLLSSCAKEYDNTITIPGENPEPERIVNSCLTGHIMHNDRWVLKNATIHVGNTTTTSNKFGWFNFENIPMDAKGQLIKITKDGYYDQYKLIYPEVDKDPYISSILLFKSQQGNFQSSDGGLITGDKIKINFQPNSIVNNQNQTYDGEVIVYQSPINPDDENFDFITPGNLRSIDENGDNTILQSFAMSVIKLESTAGEPLNLKEGSSAQLTFTIPNTHLGEAPESIPLWYFDEDTGYWIEEGVASKQGSEYIGDVTHFSFWNCDVSRQAIKLSFRVVDSNDDPLRNSIVRVITSAGLISNAVSTDQNGYASGVVPGFINLDLIVYGINGDCDNSDRINLGSFSQDTDLGDIEVEEAYLTTTKIRVVDCDGMPLPNTKIVVLSNFSTFNREYIEATSDSNGDLFVALNECALFNGEYQITNLDSGHSSSIKTFNSPDIETELQEITFCNETTAFVQASGPNIGYSSNNVTATITEEGGINGEKTIEVLSENGNQSFNFEIKIRDLAYHMYAHCDVVYFNTQGINFVSGGEGDFGSPLSFQGIVGEEIQGFVILEFDQSGTSEEILLDFYVRISE